MRVSKSKRRLFALLLSSSGLTLIGCGTQQYEGRLQETSNYFAYLDRVNNSLAPRWDELGVVVRVPKQFELLDAPQVKFDDGGNPVPILPENDPRQPDFIRRPLPGLLGAWEWTEAAGDDNEAGDDDEAGDEGNDEQRDNEQAPDELGLSSYIYVLGNHQMWIARHEDGDIEPLEFFQTAGKELARAFSLPAPSTNEPWDWQSERVPGRGQYRPQQDFELVEFDEKEINGVPSNLSIYRHQATDIQIMLVILVPTELESSGDLQQRIRYMLEWLTVSDAVPSRHSSGGPVTGV